MGYACYILLMGEIRKTTLIVKVVKSGKMDRIVLLCFCQISFLYRIAPVKVFMVVAGG